MAERLSKLEQLDGLFRCEASLWHALGVETPPVIPVIDGRPAEIGWRDVEKALTGIQTSPFADDSEYPTTRLNVVITDGVLIGLALGMVRGAGVLVSRAAVEWLTRRLMHDPWPALLVLFYIEVQESHTGKGPEAKGRPAVTMFQDRWSVEQASEWITTEQGKGSIRAYQDDVFGSRGRERLEKLLEDLPLPGGLDDPTVSTISYGDPPARIDLLNLHPYVEAFKRVILNTQTATPLTIAVLGEWGKGKTSFMQFLREALEQHRPLAPKKHARNNGAGPAPLAPRAVTVWFDAWQYNSEEKVLAALLQTVAQEIERHFTPYSWLKYRLLLGAGQLLRSWGLWYTIFVNALLLPAVLLLGTIVVLTIGPQLPGADWDIAKAGEAALKEVLSSPGNN
jgi:hypothetical protein